MKLAATAMREAMSVMTFPPLLPAVVVLLAVGLIAGCARAGDPGATTARPGTASAAATLPGPEAAQRPAGSAAPAAPGAPQRSGTAGAASRPGCARWPAGSSGSALLVTAASGGKTYCVRTGQVVVVPLSGPSALPGGSELPRLTGDALAAAPVHLLRPPSVTYLAVRPGTATLTIVGLPCHGIQPAQGAAASARAGALARAAAAETPYRGFSVLAAGTAPAQAASAPAAQTAYRAPAVPAPGTARAAKAGGTPGSAECAVQQALRVPIVVS